MMKELVERAKKTIADDLLIQLESSLQDLEAKRVK